MTITAICQHPFATTSKSLDRKVNIQTVWLGRFALDVSALKNHIGGYEVARCVQLFGWDICRRADAESCVGL
ncbi:hypothetical protein D3C85_933110 [compost metagenome]